MGHIDQYRGPYRLSHIGDGPYRLATVLTPSSKQIKLALIFSSKSVNPGSHLTNPICKVKERVGEVWVADMSGADIDIGAYTL